MANDMVMRSVYLRPEEDAQLRQLAFHLQVTKSDLIRSAISTKLVEWLKSGDPELVFRDLEHGRRPTAAERAQARGDAAEPRPATEERVAEPVMRGAAGEGRVSRGAATTDSPPKRERASGSPARARQREHAVAG